MLVRSCDESLPAGEPDLTRRPGASGGRLALTDDVLGDEHDPPA
jgi:hypothetical protein